VALGRSGRWHAARQSHLQLSQRNIFIPRAFLNLSFILSIQLGLVFLFISKFLGIAESHPSEKVVSPEKQSFSMDYVVKYTTKLPDYKSLFLTQMT
jgi:hypothetical protein